MVENFMKQNDDKTEFSIIGNYRQEMKVTLPSIRVDDAEIEKVDTVQNLGVMSDSDMSTGISSCEICKLSAT